MNTVESSELKPTKNSCDLPLTLCCHTGLDPVSRGFAVDFAVESAVAQALWLSNFAFPFVVKISFDFEFESNHMLSDLIRELNCRVFAQKSLNPGKINIQAFFKIVRY